jgi:hypothetical protein
MWVFSRYGMVSVSAFKGKFNVRARDRKHLEALMERFTQMDAKILVTPKRDYYFRIEVARDVWVKVVAEMAAEQTWGNFKNEVAVTRPQDEDYLDALHEVWEVMWNLQAKKERASATRRAESA